MATGEACTNISFELLQLIQNNEKNYTPVTELALTIIMSCIYFSPISGFSIYFVVVIDIFLGL
jgi:hypothetical protein